MYTVSQVAAVEFELCAWRGFEPRFTEWDVSALATHPSAIVDLFSC